MKEYSVEALEQKVIAFGYSRELDRAFFDSVRYVYYRAMNHYEANSPKPQTVDGVAGVIAWMNNKYFVAYDSGYRFLLRSIDDEHRNAGKQELHDNQADGNKK